MYRLIFGKAVQFGEKRGAFVFNILLGKNTVCCKSVWKRQNADVRCTFSV